MAEFELPEGWVTTQIEKIALVEMGQSPESQYYNDKKIGLPFFQGKAEFGKLYPKVKKWCSEPKKIAEAKDILLSVRAPVGPTNVALERSCIGRGLAAIRADKYVNQIFLLYFFKNKEEWLSKQGSGSTFSAVSGEFIRSLSFSFPPLAEQHEIASRLDTLLAQVDATKARLDGIPVLLKRFRQSVLAAAVSGKLTEGWRKINFNSQEWKNVTLAELFQEKPRNGYSPKSVDYPTNVKSLTLSATTSGVFKAECFKYIDEKIPVESHLWLQPKDILIQRANTIDYVGISAIYSGEPKTFIYPDLMMKCRANNKIHTKYLHYILLSNDVRKYFRENATGTAGNMPKINQQTVLSAPAILPPLEEQTQIVARVEALFAFADLIEARVKAAQAQVNMLTQAILAKAFRGELTAAWRAQHPELISGENSAEALLARIQAERGQSEKPAKKAGKKAGQVRKAKSAAPAEPVADDLPAGQLNLPGLLLPEAVEAGR